MTPSNIPHVARHLMEQHGIWQHGWRFRLDHARSRAGQCRYGAKIISLSRHYVALNVADRLDDVINTILHEIAHALAGHDAHHGPEWQAACNRVGARPERCYDSTVIVMPPGRFAARCPGCSKEFRRHKLPRTGTRTYHIDCGPDRGRLAYVDSAAKPPPTDGANVDNSPPPPPTRLR